MVGDITPAGLYRIVDRYKPTLLIDECESAHFESIRALRKMLRIGNAPRVPVIRNGRAYDVFGAKAISGEWPLSDAALASRCVQVNLIPSGFPVETLDFCAQETLAQKYQADLLAYAIHNLETRRSRQWIDTLAFSPRSKDFVRALAVGMGGDTFLEKRLVEILAQQDYETREDYKSEPLAVLVRTLYQMSHEMQSSAPAGNIALAMEPWWACNYDPRELSGRKVGSMLRSLGLKTRSLGSVGRGIFFDPSTRRSIHRLARDFGFRLSDLLSRQTIEAGKAGPPCAYCQEFGLNVTEEGQELRCVRLPVGRRRRRSLLEASDPIPV